MPMVNSVAPGTDNAGIEKQKAFGVHAEGFQKALKPIRTKHIPNTSTSTNNPFDVLENDVEEIQGLSGNSGIQKLVFGEHVVSMEINVGGGNSSAGNG